LVSGVYRSRLGERIDQLASHFMSSIKDDERILLDDVLGTMAHDIMLHEQKIISKQDLKAILISLEELRTFWIQDKIKLDPEFEDVHEFVEDYIIKKLGQEVGGKLHTGRSRNDQVALDLRMYIRRELNEISRKILDLINILLIKASDTSDAVMVGYTHLQHGQITTFGHYLLSYADALFRDLKRIRECYTRLKSPLGACALAGSSFSLDRMKTAKLLGFNDIVENSIDAVSSRDFAIETVSCLAIVMMNLSRISQDLIVWSSTEFSYVEVSDEYASTSSVMPQKKNPSTLELIRGKTGTVYGELVNLLTIFKALMTGYNLDHQETKMPLWNSVDVVENCLQILTGIIKTLKVNENRMSEIASESYSGAIDLAEELVRKGLSFRESHRLVGVIVKKYVESGKSLNNLFSEDVAKYSQDTLGKKITITEKELNRTLDPVKSLSSRQTTGSPNSEEVKRMIKDRKRKSENQMKSLTSEVQRIEKVYDKLLRLVSSYMK
jgi:argininosuccinate lyase